MRIHINHTTRYSYNESVKNTAFNACASPRKRWRTSARLSWRMTLPRLSSEVYDGFGNYCTILNLAGPLQSLEIQAQGTVEIGGSAEHILDKRIHPLAFLNSTALTGCNEAMRDFAEIQTGGTARPARPDAAEPRRARPHDLHSRHHPCGHRRRRSFCVGQRRVSRPRPCVFSLRARLGRCLPAMCRATCSATTMPTWPATPGQKPASTENGMCSTPPTSFSNPATMCSWPWGWTDNDAAPVRGMRQGGGTEQMSFSVQVQQAQ